MHPAVPDVEQGQHIGRKLLHGLQNAGGGFGAHHLVQLAAGHHGGQAALLGRQVPLPAAIPPGGRHHRHGYDFGGQRIKEGGEGFGFGGQGKGMVIHGQDHAFGGLQGGIGQARGHQ